VEAKSWGNETTWNLWLYCSNVYDLHFAQHEEILKPDTRKPAGKAQDDRRLASVCYRC
jgi:hypothetical protein